MGADDVKKLTGEVKAKISGSEEGPAEVNEEAFDEAFGEVEKNDDGNAEKEACKAFLVANIANL